MLDHFAVSQLFAFLLIFCRVGSALMVMPGYGETYVSARIRLLLALALSVLLTPTLRQMMPPVPVSPITLTALLCAEILTGLFIGGLSRLIMVAMHIGGMVIAYQSSLISALVSDISQVGQGTALGNLLSFSALVLIFTTDLHHAMLLAVTESYTLLAPGLFPSTGDFANHAVSSVGKSFSVAFQLSAPLIVVGLLLYLGGGILSRLMPNIQFFFIIQAPQLMLSFFIIMTTISGVMLGFLNYYRSSIGAFLAP